MVEARVAQLWFWEGFYARSGIDLQRHFQPETLQVTDLDLLAFDFNPQLARSKYIGEVKTGTGKSAAKPLDRIIWLRGLRELVGAESAELTIAHSPSDRVREVARGLSVVAQSVSDFQRREKEAVGTFGDLGAHGVRALQATLAVHETCRRDPELERAFWFLRSAVWFLDPFTAVKQTIDLLRRLTRRWAPRVEDDDTAALRWLFCEAASVLTLNLVTIAGLSLTVERRDFSVLVGERLAEGVVPMTEMRRLSDSIDRYIGGVLTAAKVSAHVRTDAMGAFLPQPPDYAETLAELTWRLGRVPLAARSLPRQVDLLLFERVANRREVQEPAAQRLGLARADSTRLRSLVAAFLRGCGASPDAVDVAFVTPVPLLSIATDQAAAVQAGIASSKQEALFGAQRADG
jgi:hypothetical protein